MSVSEIFRGISPGTMLFGTINGYAGCIYEHKPGTFIVCTNQYNGTVGDKNINASTGYSGFVSIGGSFSGFIPNWNTKTAEKQPQKTDVIKITIIEFETFEKVNQNF
jgi:hypothetical protein